MGTIDGAALVEANGTAFHVEVTGHGTPLLLVPGAGGDARQYAELAQILAQNHAVIAYDRRNNGRSPQQPDWAETSVDQHAGRVFPSWKHSGRSHASCSATAPVR